MLPSSIELTRTVALSSQAVIPALRSQLVSAAAASERGTMHLDSPVPGGGRLTVPVRLRVRYPALGGRRFELTVEAASATPLYPRFDGTLELRAAGPAETTLSLRGTYEVPLGVVGRVIDATAARGIATASLSRFLDGLVDELRGSAAAAAESAYRAGRHGE